jgi:hypothetical protein
MDIDERARREWGYSDGILYMITNSRYKKYKRNYYLYGFYYKENFFIKTKVISKHTIKDTKERSMESDIYVVKSKGCQ